MTNPPPKRSFIFDFDGTITTKDTISTLFQIALSIQCSKGIDRSKAREEILSQYSADFKSHIASYTPEKKDRLTLRQEIEYQRSLRDVEIRSFTRVSKSEIFAGISARDWYGQGRSHSSPNPRTSVEIRKGFPEFLTRLWSEKEKEWANGKWGIVSVNFSVSFVRGVLGSFLGEELAKELDILANEPREEDGVLEGPIINGKKEVIATSDGKLGAMKELLRRWEEKGEEVGQVFYFGDSGTDLECLKEANVGIILADDADGTGSLMDTMKRIEMDVYHIEDFRDRDENTSYWAPDFEQIKRGIFK